MRDRLIGGHALQFLVGKQPQRPAARGQRDHPHFGQIVAVEALEDRVVLRIDRQQRRAVPRHRFGHHFAGGHQRFLVGERDGAALLDRGHHRGEPGAADDRGHGDVDRARRRLDQGRTAARRLDPAACQRLAQFGQAGLVADDRDLRVELACQLGQPGGAAMGGQRLDAPVGAMFAQQAKSGVADRARGAEDGYRTHQIVMPATLSRR